MLIDTHSHLFSEKFVEDRSEVVQRAKDNGVEKILLPNIDIDSIKTMHELEDSDPTFFKSMMGIHPCYITKDYEAELEITKNWFSKRDYCAIGEIGIDLYWEKELIEQQQNAFRAQLKLAKELKLPVAIHARDSFQEIFKIVEEENDENLTGVFHCFIGGKDEAEKIMSFGGFKMGLGGVLTFKKSGLDKTVFDIPMEEFVLETDSPYLAPTPNRGKRNESSFLLHIAEKLANVKGISLKTVAEITTINAIELFKLD
jgi:TatD DNase family protein